MHGVLVLPRLAVYQEVLDIGNRNVILRLSYLTWNAFSVDSWDRCLRNLKNGQVIPYSVK